MSEVWSIDELVGAVLNEFPEKYKPEVLEVYQGEFVHEAILRASSGDIIRLVYSPLAGRKPVEVFVMWEMPHGVSIYANDRTEPDTVGATALGLLILVGRFKKILSRRDVNEPVRG